VKSSRIILFGGWAGKWLDDIYSLDVSKLIGPPYLITGVSPSIGPITGGTELTVEGVDFFNTSDIVVRFGTSNEHIDVRGVFCSSSTIACTTPDFNGIPLISSLDVRVALRGDSFTTSYQVFKVALYCCLTITR
jgi:dynein heavy chain